MSAGAPRAEHLLALDLGTTSVRALLLHASGHVVGRAQQPLPARYPEPGRVEQDPLALWERSVAVLRAALDAAGLAARDVAALGVVTQRSTALAWDAADGTPLAPAIGWQDRRTAERVAVLNARGIPINTLASASKFEWLLRHEPRVREAASRGRLCLGTPDVWLTARLTEEAFATDPSQASCTGLLDLAAGDWWPAALGLFGLEPDWLPRVVATDAVVGMTPAALLGAPVAVAARAGDQQAATFAQGAHAEGSGKLTLGTAAMLDVHTGAAPRRGARGAYPLALWTLSDGSRAFGLEGTVVTAGAAVDWLVDLGLLPDAGALDALAGSVADSEGVCFVPALQGLGTPHLDDGARGLLGGLTRATTRAHVARALLEGVAQRCADLCEALPLAGALRTDGGLARSDRLLQALADFSGRPVWRAAETETTALGAAQLAGLGAGLYASPGDARPHAAAAREFEPLLDRDERERRRADWAHAVARARSDS
ncbi:MAG: FGGY family carbohydrate kinase [Myxococcota bacterium]|nr:FGGY family carbohydrate kinase [Myxococcota bacterium]